MIEIPISKHNCLGHLDLELGIYLDFACLPVGREFVIWNLFPFRQDEEIWLKVL